MWRCRIHPWARRDTIYNHPFSGRILWLPKGHMENGETEKETAYREIREETGLTVTWIDGFRTTDEHPYIREGRRSWSKLYISWLNFGSKFLVPKNLKCLIFSWCPMNGQWTFFNLRVPSGFCARPTVFWRNKYYAPFLRLAPRLRTVRSFAKVVASLFLFGMEKTICPFPPAQKENLKKWNLFRFLSSIYMKRKFQKFIGGRDCDRSRPFYGFWDEQSGGEKRI